MLTVGVVSPGAMGAALARGWAEGGARAVATVAGRSERTRSLAYGIELLGSLDEVVAASDVVVSVVPPGEAVAVATEVAAAAARAGVTPLVADLNAVSPATVARITAALGGLPYVDGAISGGPPNTSTTRVYVSGDRAAELAGLAHPRLDVVVVPGPPGAASAVKMSTASVYKGFAALLLHALAAAERNGVTAYVLDDLAREFPGLVANAGPQLASAGSKAHRYVAEMREIAATQAAAGLGGELFEAMALVWERVAATPLGAGTPEAARDASLADALRLLGGQVAGPPA